VEIHADLIVGCNGRSSVIREQSGLPITEFPMPIDVLWFRLPRDESAPESLGFIGGGFERVKAAGLAAFRSTVAAAAPFLATSLNALTDWDQVMLLSVRANRLRRWWLPVNYAIADAVATANALAGPLQNGAVTDKDLRAVQKRREAPTKRLLGRIVGLGFRREHIHTAEQQDGLVGAR
jgi:hypothetical protein